MINYQKRIGDWNFAATLTGSTIKNEVKKMGNPVMATNDGGDNDPASKTSDGSNIGTIGAADGFHWGDHSRSEEGEAVGSYYGYVVEGIFRTEEELAAANRLATDKAIERGDVKPDEKDPNKILEYYQVEGTKVGDFKFKDLNGDGKITEDDRKILGNGFPKFNYGINLTANYKNWDFSIYGYGVAGYKIFSYSAMRLSTMFSGDDQTVPNLLKESSDDAWSPENPNGSLPRLSITDVNNNMRASDAWVKKADYFKISNIQVGYTFPRQTIERLKLSNARVYVSVSNLVTFSKYKKYGDPEVGQGCVLYSGLDAGRYPMPRVFQAGLSFSF
jgi:hypothetical protein